MGKRALMGCVVAVAASTMVATGCGKFGTVDTGGGSTATTSGDGTSYPFSKLPFDAAEQKAAGCTPVQDQPDNGRTHAPNTDTKIVYKQNPPTSGEHWPPVPNQVPRPWGVYTTTQPDEAMVHNLEHGELDIDYKGLSDSELKELLDTRKKAPRYINVMPRNADPKNGVYYLAWDEEIYCAHPSAPALQEMATQFIDQGPEPITTEPPKDTSETPKT